MQQQKKQEASESNAVLQLTTKELSLVLICSFALAVGALLFPDTVEHSLFFLAAASFFAYSFFQLLIAAMRSQAPTAAAKLQKPQAKLVEEESKGSNVMDMEKGKDVNANCQPHGNQVEAAQSINEEDYMKEACTVPLSTQCTTEPEVKKSWFDISEEDSDECLPIETAAAVQLQSPPPQQQQQSPSSHKPGGGDSGSKSASGNRSSALVPAAAAVFNKPIYKQVSASPVAAPTFTGAGWDDQVKELLLEMTPTAASDAAVMKIAETVQDLIQPLLPDAEVIGFANANISRGVAFGVAIPEIDIVVNACPSVLAGTLPRFKGDGCAQQQNNRRPQILQKCAIRACTDILTSRGVFKFRRSAFRGEDPKVTLFVPASVIDAKDGVAIDFSVNNATPLHCAALITECGNLNMRAKELILLVRRWARDRGVAHVSKGHLSPYAWTLLTVYFLQVRHAKYAASNVQPEAMGRGAPLLPSLSTFPKCSALAGLIHKPAAADAANDIAAVTSVASLFKEFIEFFDKDFKWQDEAVSVRAGRRGPVPLQLPINVIIDQQSGKAEMPPAIEDPFDVKRNLGNSMTASSLVRLRSELSRANWHCKHDACLSQLLEPWVPPEQEAGSEEKAEQR
jgi:hypothetical protein